MCVFVYFMYTASLYICIPLHAWNSTSFSSAKTFSCMQGVNQLDIVELENKICVVFARCSLKWKTSNTFEREPG